MIPFIPSPFQPLTHPVAATITPPGPRLSLILGTARFPAAEIDASVLRARASRPDLHPVPTPRDIARCPASRADTHQGQTHEGAPVNNRVRCARWLARLFVSKRVKGVLARSPGPHGSVVLRLAKFADEVRINETDIKTGRPALMASPRKVPSTRLSGRRDPTTRFQSPVDVCRIETRALHASGQPEASLSLLLLLLLLLFLAGGRSLGSGTLHCVSFQIQPPLRDTEQNTACRFDCQATLAKRVSKQRQNLGNGAIDPFPSQTPLQNPAAWTGVQRPAPKGILSPISSLLPGRLRSSRAGSGSMAPFGHRVASSLAPVGLCYFSGGPWGS
ncbi:hypothetical protein B0J18DRAFT_87242 [Chaetomium sp. MPI-SDFR-AT-0129]|nr:hypothetical protein B0J18DRAFT_87242 [Chaetomium sp. MPI-SDFR-AT-0129]